MNTVALYMGSTGIFGGTFDTLHDGHKALFLTAFEQADHVIIGVTADEKANGARERNVSSYEKRVSTVRDFCKTLENVYDCTFQIDKITGPYDKAIHANADFIVLSPEPKTHSRAEQINDEREENDLNRLRVIEAPYVTDYNNRKISATRIANREIDTHGEKIEES